MSVCMSVYSCDCPCDCPCVKRGLERGVGKGRGFKDWRTGFGDCGRDGGVKGIVAVVNGDVMSALALALGWVGDYGGDVV